MRQRKQRRQRTEPRLSAEADDTFRLRLGSMLRIEFHLRYGFCKCFVCRHLILRDCACHLRSRKTNTGGPPSPAAESCGEAGEWPSSAKAAAGKRVTSKPETRSEERRV